MCVVYHYTSLALSWLRCHSFDVTQSSSNLQLCGMTGEPAVMRRRRRTRRRMFCS